MTETYFIAGFIGGLQGELRNFVKMMNPTTFDDAIAFARLQDGGSNTMLAKSRAPSTTKTAIHSTKSYSPNTTYKPCSNTNSFQTTYEPKTKTITNPSKLTNSNYVLPFQKISPIEM